MSLSMIEFYVFKFLIVFNFSLHINLGVFDLKKIKCDFIFFTDHFVFLLNFILFVLIGKRN